MPQAPVSATTTYEDQATPQTSDIAAARTGLPAGLVPSPTAHRAGRSHKKQTSAVGVRDTVDDGRITPTSARRKGGKRANKAPIKGKKVSRWQTRQKTVADIVSGQTGYTQ
jgi:hypothetical protein